MGRFFDLSRTAHGLLDMAAPAFTALLCLGGFPPVPTIALSLLTAFAAYTAIYALNDLVGLPCDLEKFSGPSVNPGYSMDASTRRHPIAQGMLSVRSGLLWMIGWFGLALIGSYVLNPSITLVLLGAAALEIVYCRLLKVTHLRTLLGGLIKSSGPISAVLVADASPSPLCVALVLAWAFFWELGGQNIPSDWNDTEEDRRVNARTIPIRFGLEKAGLIVLSALALSVLASGFLPLISPKRLGVLYVVVSLLLGYFLLLRPGFRLYMARDGRLAARLFESASYYPLAMLVLITAFIAPAELAGL